MEKIIEIVVIQNFIRLGIVVDISNYEVYKEKNKLFEYLVMIAFIEVGASRPLEFWRVWELRKNKKNFGNLAVEMLSKSSKCRSLIPLLKKYYFEDSDIIYIPNYEVSTLSKIIEVYTSNNEVVKVTQIYDQEGTFCAHSAAPSVLKNSEVKVKIPEIDIHPKVLEFLKIVKKAFNDFRNCKALQVALMGHVKLSLQSFGTNNFIELNNKVFHTSFYHSTRKPLPRSPNIYSNNDEAVLAETCVLWMHIKDSDIKTTIIDNSEKLAKMIFSSTIESEI